MLRTLFTLALSLVLLAETNAQTAAIATSKPTAKPTPASARASRRAAKKAHRVALKTATRTTDGWPALADVPVAAPADAAVAYEAAPAARADAGVAYAGPGMPIHIRTSREIVPYSVRPARKPASGQTTLTTGN